MEFEKFSKKMRKDWNKRAETNVRKYIALESWKTREMFDKSGLIDSQKVLKDIEINRNWRVLEIGVGIGRIAKHMSKYFNEVYGLDVSNETIKIAQDELKEYNNVKIYQNNGIDLSILSESNIFDLVYSVKVFQHMPRKVFLNYLDEIRRVLKPNGLLKFQIFEKTKLFGIVPWYYLRNLKNYHLKFWQEPPETDTWIARSYSRDDVKVYLQSKGYECLTMENPTGQEGDLWITAKLTK